MGFNWVLVSTIHFFKLRKKELIASKFNILTISGNLKKDSPHMFNNENIIMLIVKHMRTAIFKVATCYSK